MSGVAKVVEQLQRDYEEWYFIHLEKFKAHYQGQPDDIMSEWEKYIIQRAVNEEYLQQDTIQ